MPEEPLAAMLDRHRRWLEGGAGGCRLVLRRAQLDDAALPGARLRYAGLGHSSLRRADLRQADLSASDLRFADLSQADLRGATLRDADLRWSVLKDANLLDANLTRARLKGAVLAGITVNWTDRTLVAEILWRAAGDDTFRRMVAAFIGREETWCWEKFLAIPSAERTWAVDELRRWMRDGDDAPELLRRFELTAPSAGDPRFTLPVPRHDPPAPGPCSARGGWPDS
jgi:Pentapeptide repeats (8 copies)